VKSRKLGMLVAVILAGSVSAFAQTQPNLENGFKPYGSYDGGTIDSVNLMNGGQVINIPAPFQYPQRGGRLSPNYSLYLSSKNWAVQCVPNAGVPSGELCGWEPAMEAQCTTPLANLGDTTTQWCAFPTGVALTHSLNVTVKRTMTNIYVYGGPVIYLAYGYSLVTWDMAVHQLFGVPSTLDGNNEATRFDTVDGSGYHVRLSNPDSTGVQTTVVVTDRQGNQYQGSFPTSHDCTIPPLSPFPFGDPGAGYRPEADQVEDGTFNCGELATVGVVTDGNGNVFSYASIAAGNVSTGADTLGRSPSLPVAGDTTDCVSPLAISGTTVSSFPGPNGASSPVKLCYSNVPLQTNFSQPNIPQVQQASPLMRIPMALNLVHTVVLPDHSKWTFTYDSYGEVTHLGLPLGGSIDYTWTEIAFNTCAGSGTETQVSRAVATRTVNDNNGHSFQWSYQWGTPSGGLLTNTVTDPLSNDTVHVFTALDSQCAFFETRTQYFQGSGGSRQLLKQVDTTYASTGFNTEADGHAINAFAQDVQTTIYPSGKVSKVHKDPDPGPGGGRPIFGNAIKELDYDWGIGTPGALLRETDTTYQWQVNSAYLTANMVGLPSAAVVKDASGNRMAETDYVYDESAYLTAANIATQHGAAPSPVRGNLTTSSHWLNTSNSFISSHTNWYDTGEAYQSIDPLGHTTMHSYDPAYAGAYATQTCSPPTTGGTITHCVSGTYDFNTGLLASFTNENATTQASGTTPGDSAHTSNYTYDALGRLTLAQAPPDPANGGARAQNTFNYSPANVFPLTAQRLKSITNAMSDSATSTFDGLGRPYKTQHAVPGNTATVDTVYDGLHNVISVTNPYFSTSDPTYGLIQTQYDALGRAKATTKQDGSISSIDYSAGNCTVATDEAGKQRRACSDGIGRLVEVDEPGDSFAGSQASGGVSTSGTLQSKVVGAVNAAAGTGSLTVTGPERSITVGGDTYCAVWNNNGDCVDWEVTPSTTVYDAGTVTITVNGHSDSTSYGSASAAINIASSLASAINGDGSAFVNASASNGVLSLTARQTGASTDYSWSISSITSDPGDFGAGTGSFGGSAASGALAGGATGSGGTTVYDAGMVTVTIGTFTASASYGQSGNGTAAAVVAALVGTGSTGLSRSGSPVNASASGSNIAITYNSVGTAGNIAFSCSSSTSQTAYFSSPSFTCPATGTLAGGANPEGISLDHNYFVTQYAYDALGNLTAVTQKGDPAVTNASQWRVRTFTYDSLSRLLTANNPESGTISYVYDADSELLQKTSPSANQTGSATTTISFCYDALHRVSGRAYTAQACPLATPVVAYTYDIGTNAKGHLTSLTDQAGSATYNFDVLGRMSSEQRTIAGVSKSLSYRYNLDGSVATVTYPSGAAVTYTPDSAGRMLSAVDSGNGINYATGATYGPDSAVTGFINGNSGGFAGINNTFSYNKRLQPINMSASAPGQTVFSIGYDFHVGNGASGTDNGNVWGITNYKDNTRNQSFTYDALNRLTSAQNAGTNCATTTINGKTEYWGNSYGYDAWGNLLAKTVTKCGAENLSLTALANNQLSSYSYDAAGNMTHDATSGLNYPYDQENRVTGAGGFTYTYDGDGNRVEKTNGSTGTLYWYASIGIVGESDLTGTMKSEYVFFDGERVGRRDLIAPTGVFYYFSDHLKTASVITDSAGNIKSESDYYPWGGELQFTSNDSNHYKFTCKERDSESGLDYFGARYYSNGLGRFISADWSATPIPVPYAEFGDPQSLNLYSYVRNVPTTKLDADGHCPWCPAVERILEEAAESPEGRVIAENAGKVVAGIGGGIAAGWAASSNFAKDAWQDGIEALGKSGGTMADLPQPKPPQGLFGPLQSSEPPGGGPGHTAQPEGKGTVVIGKVADLSKPGALQPGERKLDLPNQGNPKANWAQNSGKMREAMKDGNPIRDASVKADGTPRDNTGFLRAERNELQNKGWTYDKGTTTWNPPKE